LLLSKTLTNQNLCHTIDVEIQFFLLVEAALSGFFSKAREDALGITGRWLVLHFLLSKAIREIRQCCDDETAALPTFLLHLEQLQLKAATGN
jgi:hypothetical protein